MKIKDITDIHISVLSESDPKRFCICWNAGGARYHVWNPQLDTLYKNPSFDTPRYLDGKRNPADYDTRRLSVSAHADVIEYVRKFVADNDLVARARVFEKKVRDAKEAAYRTAELDGYQKVFREHLPIDMISDILSDDEIIALGRAIKNS